MRRAAFCLLFIVLFIFTLPFPRIVLAQSQTAESNLSPDVPRTTHNMIQGLLIDTLSAVSCQLNGIDPASPTHECLGVDKKTGKIGFVKQGGGVIGVMSTLIGSLYVIPIHTADFVAYSTRDFGITKHAYAATGQGIGFAGLQPLFGLWTAFRNMTYLLFALIFIIIGVAIMLRVKIDARTVMTIENQIPNIIIGILLITFSIAIAGLLIDLMYLIIYILFNVFSDPNIVPASQQADFAHKLADTQKTFNSQNPFVIFNNLVEFTKLITDSAGGVKDIVQNILSTTEDTFLLSGILNFFGSILGWFFGVAMLVILSIAVIIALFRLWISLLYSYVYILVGIVLAPFWIFLGFLPGSEINFQSWMRHLLANLSAFPVTIGMFLMGRVFMTAFDGSNGQLFVPPLIGNPGNSLQPISSLIGLGIILMTSTVVEMMKDLIKAPTFKWTVGIGQTIGGASQAPKRVGGNVLSHAFGEVNDNGMFQYHKDGLIPKIGKFFNIGRH